MDARIICFCNQKGGPGKSTLSVSIAAALGKRDFDAERKCRVAVVDGDPQGTATRWISMAPESKPFPASVLGLSLAGDNIGKEILKFVKDYDYIIIDTPPAVDSIVPQYALLVSDIAIVPLIPSPPDLWSSIAIKKVIRMASGFNKDLRAMTVLNRCQERQILTREIGEFLTGFTIPLAKTRVGQRAVFGQVSAVGLSVHDISEDGKAASEIDGLADDILSAIKTWEPIALTFERDENERKNIT